eukprot:1077820-Heterocapsa_arctica.AAC.1
MDQASRDIYPGVSSQKRVRIRAEQLFKESQANKAIQKQEALQKKLQHKTNKDIITLEEGDKHIQQVKENCHPVEVKKHNLTCIASVGHEVDRINGDTKKRSNNEQSEIPNKAAKSCKISQAHIEQETNSGPTEKEQRAAFMQIQQAK